MAPSTAIIQYGWSPCSVRCSDQLMDSRHGSPAMRRASARIRSASMSHRAGGPLGILGDAVVLRR